MALKWRKQQWEWSFKCRWKWWCCFTQQKEKMKLVTLRNMQWVNGAQVMLLRIPDDTKWTTLSLTFLSRKLIHLTLETYMSCYMVCLLFVVLLLQVRCFVLFDEFFSTCILYIPIRNNFVQYYIKGFKNISKWS